MFGSDGECLLGSCGILCHLRGLFSLLPRDGEPLVKEAFRGGVGESVNMLFFSNCSYSSDSEKTGLNITFRASSSLARNFFFVKGALFDWSVGSTNKCFLGALGDYNVHTTKGYNRYGTLKSYVSIRSWWFSWLLLLILHSNRRWTVAASRGCNSLTAERRPTHTSHVGQVVRQ